MSPRDRIRPSCEICHEGGRPWFNLSIPLPKRTFRNLVITLVLTGGGTGAYSVIRPGPEPTSVRAEMAEPVGLGSKEVMVTNYRCKTPAVCAVDVGVRNRGDAAIDAGIADFELAGEQATETVRAVEGNFLRSIGPRDSETFHVVFPRPVGFAPSVIRFNTFHPAKRVVVTLSPADLQAAS